MATSRETARDALVALLEAALVGAGLPVKTVSGSKQPSLEGITPLVTVLGAGSERVPMTYQGNRVTFTFVVTVWVLQSGTDWTTAQAEDALDDIEARIAAVYEENTQLVYAAATIVTDVAVAGVPYYVETIPTNVILTRS